MNLTQNVIFHDWVVQIKPSSLFSSPLPNAPSLRAPVNSEEELDSGQNVARGDDLTSIPSNLKVPFSASRISFFLSSQPYDKQNRFWINPFSRNYVVSFFGKRWDLKSFTRILKKKTKLNPNWVLPWRHGLQLVKTSSILFCSWFYIDKWAIRTCSKTLSGHVTRWCLPALMHRECFHRI